MIDLDYIRLEKYFVDGTEVEANANRYSFVWKKSKEKQKAGLQEKVKALMAEIEDLEKKKSRNTGKRIWKKLGKTKRSTQKS